MDRSRRRRQFNRDADESREQRERFRFPLNVDGNDRRPDEHHKPDNGVQSEEEDSFIRREQRKALFEETKKQDKSRSSFTISKAREIPSAVHGTRRHQASKNTEENKNDTFKKLPEANEVPSVIHGTKKDRLTGKELSQLEADSDKGAPRSNQSGYVSPIIENLKKERLRRIRKEQERLQAQQEREARERARYDDPYSMKSESAEPEKTGPSEDMEPKPAADEKVNPQASSVTSPFNVIMTPYDKKKHMNANKKENKRKGPKYTMPSVHILGNDQVPDYDRLDEKLESQIKAAFEAVGVPAKVHSYKSNGIIGRYEMSLDRNFRLSNLGRLKEYLLPHLPFDNVRIIAPVIGDSNIGLEVPLPEPKEISFGSVFSSSSLKLRKNDFKFAIGKTVDDKIFSYEIQKAGHMLIYGQNEQDSGNVVDNILVSLMMNHNPNEFRVMIASDKPRYADYEELPHLFGEQKSIMEPGVLSDILKELNDRHNQFRRAHVRNLNSFNQRVNYESRKSTIAVVIDDFSTLIENNNPDAVRTIIQILKKGKPLGVHLIMRHTRSDVGIRFELLQMMQTRISFKDEKSKVVETSDELVDGNDMLIQIPTSNKPLRVNAGVLPAGAKEKLFSHLKRIGG